MAIERHGWLAQQRLRAAGRAAAATLAEVSRSLRPGMTTADVDALVRADTKARGGRPSQLGYHGFPAAVCVSRNDVVCHGIPSDREWLLDGDIVNVDVTTELDGYHGDTSATFCIGVPHPDTLRLVEVARRCLAAGLEVVRPGARLGDIGHAIEALARAEGAAVVREYGGHGIGRLMHMEPHVAHVGRPGTGPRLQPGMCFTIEPMVTWERADVRLDADGWTVRTRDGRPSAQFEHTVLVTEAGREVLTACP